MVGNDIVDLRFVPYYTKRRHIRFCQKVFSEEEQTIISNSTDQSEKLWHLWSMKESAYKLLSKKRPKSLFSPSKITCNVKNESQGTIVIDNQAFHSRSKITRDYIYTLTHSEEIENIESNTIRIHDSSYQLQSKLVYQNLVKKVAQVMNENPAYFSIKKNTHGVPELYCGSQRLALDISITHHGFYCAYAFSYLNELVSIH